MPSRSIGFVGVVHLDLIEEAHERGWDVLLDGAAFVPTNRLDLGTVRPDFVSISFYKMFGYPTGVGCLLVRHAVLPKLTRPWFAGGTVNFATVQGLRHILAPREAGFEDGTLNYLAIPAVEIGLRHLSGIGIEIIHTRVRCLTGWLLQELLALAHSNGRHMVRIYGPATTTMRGGAITLNFYDPDGHLLDYRRVEELANRQRISLRTGCFCNPGAGELAEGLTESDMLVGIDEDGDMTLPRFLQVIQHRGGKSAGAIRVSLGLVTNFSDMWRFLRFAADLRDQTRLTIGDVTFDVESAASPRRQLMAGNLRSLRAASDQDQPCGGTAGSGELGQETAADFRGFSVGFVSAECPARRGSRVRHCVVRRPNPRLWSRRPTRLLCTRPSWRASSTPSPRSS